MSIEMRDALVLAERYLKEHVSPPPGDVYVIVDAATRESDEGWFFPYQTARFVSTGDIDYSVVGNWPILVTRSGEVKGPQRPIR